MNTNPFPPRVPGDIDLVHEVSEILKAAGHPQPMNWEFQLAMANPRLEGPKLQRFLINRYWRMKLGMCAEDTTAPRFCLFESGEDTDYLSVFKSSVAPFILRNKLG